jgi:hypothetical protein
MGGLGGTFGFDVERGVSGGGGGIGGGCGEWEGWDSAGLIGGGWDLGGSMWVNSDAGGKVSSGTD